MRLVERIDHFEVYGDGWKLVAKLYFNGDVFFARTRPRDGEPLFI